MNEKYFYQKRRDGLANALRKDRVQGEEEKEKAKVRLKAKKRSPEYIADKATHSIAKQIPKTARENAGGLIENIDENKWRIIDIRKLIPAEIKAAIDRRKLMSADRVSFQKEYYSQLYPEGRKQIQQKLRSLNNNESVDYSDPKELQRGEDQTKVLSEFVDTVTQGRFTDPHNMIHVITGQEMAPVGSRYVTKPIDLDSLIHPGSPNDEFYFSTHGSDYVGALDKPIMIISPLNPVARRFVEMSFERENAFHVPDPFRGTFLKNEVFHSNMDAELRFLREYKEGLKGGKGFTWMDIADTIVDLPRGRVLIRKYSEEEKEEVRKGIEQAGGRVS